MTSKQEIVNRAIEILEAAIANIKQRSVDYDQNGIEFEDYRLNGLESTWEHILECFVRLWNSGSKDKSADWAAYAALQAAFVEFGMPQSKFSPIFRKQMPEIYMSMKRQDERTQRIAAGN